MIDFKSYNTVQQLEEVYELERKKYHEQLEYFHEKKFELRREMEEHFYRYKYLQQRRGYKLGLDHTLSNILNESQSEMEHYVNKATHDVEIKLQMIKMEYEKQLDIITEVNKNNGTL